MYIKAIKHTQTIPSSLWVIQVDGNIDFAKPLFIYNDEQSDIEPNDWEYKNGILTVNFGFNEISGNLVYVYASEEAENELPKKQEFTNSRYIEVDYFDSIPPAIEVYETIHDEKGVLKCDLITLKQSIREEGNDKKIILESNKFITGFIIIR